jgi:predicted nucleic acid-binding protein
MILVDTSVWVDFLRSGQPSVARCLESALVLCHPWIIGELALGQLTPRHEVIRLLRSLPQVTTATDDEVLTLIERRRPYGLGLGWVDVHLLAAVHLTPDAKLWTTDRRLAAAAAQLGCGVEPSQLR